MSYNPQNPNGQANMANSSPVTIASDQSAVPHAAANLEVDASVTSATTIFTQDCVSPVSYRWIAIQFLAPVAWSAVTVQFEISNDNSTWFTYPLARLDGTTGAVSSSESTAGRIWGGAIQARYFRARVSAYTSGTVRAVAEFSTVPVVVMSPSLGAAQAGNWNVGLLPVTSGGLSTLKTISAASTNSTNVKSSGGQLYALQVSNINAAIRYLKLYNKATAPTVGTDTPVKTIPIPPTNGLVTLNWSNGLAFSAGIGFGLTTGLADNDTGVVAASEHVVNMDYK